MTKLHKTLLARMDKAVWEYKMFEKNDRVMVAVSGGSDSMALLDLLSLHIWNYAENLFLSAVYIDLGFGECSKDRCSNVENYFSKHRVHGEIVRTNIGPYSHSINNRENPCFLCSRMRRKNIFEKAEKFNCNKIVFGHHKDDIVETLLINMIYNREISTMPPKLEVFHGKYFIVRPLLYIEQDLIKKFCWERRIPIVDQECPTDGFSKRQYIKGLLQSIEDEMKGAKENIFASMKRVKNDYLL